MLNIGQVVYDLTNDRVLLFCGVDTCATKDTGEYFSVSAFMDEEGNFLEYDSRKEKTPFVYTNITKDGKPFMGSAVTDIKCYGHYFGILDGNNEEVRVAAIKAIKSMNEEIDIRGITRKIEKAYNGEEYTKIIIRKEVEEELQHTVSAVSQ